MTDDVTERYSNASPKSMDKRLFASIENSHQARYIYGKMA